MHGYQDGRNFGWVAKGVPATIFPHEIGHMFGCGHSRDNTPPEAAKGYEYGHKFRGSNGSGYGTMMAYTTADFPTTISYMASPSLRFEGSPTGTETADCRRAHYERVRHMSGWGLEDQDCSARAPDTFAVFFRRLYRLFRCLAISMTESCIY